MLKTNKNLIALFVTLFLLLMGIQAYFMYKSYILKKKDIYQTVKQKINLYTDKLEDQGGIEKVPNDSIQKLFARYHNNKVSKESFLEYFENNRKKTENQFSDYVDNQFIKEGYKVAVKIEYPSIVFVPTNTALNDKPITLYETRNKVVKPAVLNTGTWQTSHVSTSDNNKVIEKNESFHVKSLTSYEVLNIQSVVFKELAILIISCILILAAVIWLFVLTIKNLIKQQKQVEVLHTVVDNISHEFKTPIATLKIATKALNKNWNKDNLPLLERQIIRLENLMLQLHNDEENNKETQIITPDDWNHFIEDLRFSHSDTAFYLKNNAQKTLSFSKTDVETIIKNLCENSVKYGADKIDIEINTTQNLLEIIVKDNGKGIPKKEQKNIFEKFYRIQSDNIHNTKGLGLGLFLIKNLVEKYHGNIALSSEVNQGASFKITLAYEN